MLTLFTDERLNIFTLRGSITPFRDQENQLVVIDEDYASFVFDASGNLPPSNAALSNRSLHIDHLLGKPYLQRYTIKLWFSTAGNLTYHLH